MCLSGRERAEFLPKMDQDGDEVDEDKATKRPHIGHDRADIRVEDAEGSE